MLTRHSVTLPSGPHTTFCSLIHAPRMFLTLLTAWWYHYKPENALDAGSNAIGTMPDVPAIADAITTKFPEVGSERQDLRQYPGGSLAATWKCSINLAGATMSDGAIADYIRLRFTMDKP